ncbi:hypothetical protein [Micromonospora carbonacea]|uniref:hypothetical protein n=1 Tax=Micromonospora carbonacea TaxID=47853 RepID=UPI00181F6A79|nr:hypothetical protein [Micromonospora carbonacea]MBB5828627.1 hypothetical protein [Micromonospora carbonacea]
MTANSDLDQIFSAGVTPVELATEMDGPTLRRLAPQLTEVAAEDLSALFEDRRVRRMLDQTWRSPPAGEPCLAETLVNPLVAEPKLVRLILATPELARSLIARPVTLHHLASHPQAVEVLQSGA